ncbi:hypothetical protein [Actinacidiphila soli]|uniref:hypothetical protein n=1 Tax=Actinacidiphila soli TaxID=2487275 RepID=UPI000FC9C152|nr:hypothetical protein [Actinacidiphila soli]
MPERPAPVADPLRDISAWDGPGMDAYFVASARASANEAARIAGRIQVTGRGIRDWHSSVHDAVISTLAAAETIAPQTDRPWHAARLDAYAAAYGLRGWHRHTDFRGKHAVQVNKIRTHLDGDRGRYYPAAHGPRGSVLNPGPYSHCVVAVGPGHPTHRLRAVSPRIARQWIDKHEAVSSDTDGQPHFGVGSVDHVSCPGHVAIWAEHDEVAPAAVMFLCTDPEAYGHALKEDDAPQEEPDEASMDAGKSAAPVKPEKEEGMPYKLKVEGNAAHRAAGKTRREWLRTEFLSRKTAPKALAPFVTAQLLVCSKPVQSWTGDVSRVALLAELLGQSKTDEAAGRAEWAPGNATPGRLMLLNFAVLAACYEKRIQEVQTWRHDEPSWDTDEIRADARTYLAFLGEMGYRLAPIEQAIISGEPYTPQAAEEAEDADHEDAEEPEDADRDDQDGEDPDQDA